MPGLPGLGVLISLGATAVLLNAASAGSAASEPGNTSGRSLAAGRIAPAMSARQQCIASVTALLRGDLLDMTAGRPDAGASFQKLVERQYPADSPVLRRINASHDALLGTAAGDLFGRYARDIPAEIAAYGPRIAITCG